MNRRIGELVAQKTQSIGLILTDSEINAFEIYAAELKKWSCKVNLTAITKDREIAIKHFFDSLMLAQHLTANDRLLDIGSGAGFPVIPLKIVRPDIFMVSVDAVGKKISFQRHIIRLLALQKIEVVHTRVEELHKTERSSFSIITSRAFSSLDLFVTMAAPLLAEGGVLIAMKSEKAEAEILVSDDTLKASGFTVDSIQRYALPENMGERALTFLKPCKAI